MERLPTRLVEKILLRLPATAIVDAAQKVCRSWRTLVRDPRFACKHLSSRVGGGYLVANLPDPAVRPDVPRPFLTYVHDVDALDRGTDCAIVTFDDARLPPFTYVTQSCDGLVLLVHYDDSSGRLKRSVHLCNPLLGKWITLPEKYLGEDSEIWYRPDDLGEDHHIWYRSTRFAFDVASKKLKVFRVTWLRHPTADEGLLLHCDVMTVSATGEHSPTGDGWRRASMAEFEYCPYNDPCPSLRNGILSGSQLHWIFWTDNGLLSMMSVDVQSERIDFSPKLPVDEYDFYRCRPLSINGRLCVVVVLFDPVSGGQYSRFYGRPESPATDPSWERLTIYERSFNFLCDVISISPCEERGRGASLFSCAEDWKPSISKNQQYLYHDLRTNKIQRLWLPRYDGYWMEMVFDYTPSLLMPGI